MTPFENWYENINSEYLKSRASFSTGLNFWFNSLREGKGFLEGPRESAQQFCEDNHIGNDNKKFAMVAIAKSFYPEEYTYYQKHGNFSSKGLFKASKTYSLTLASYFEKDKIEIAFANASSHAFRQGNWYWVEIASALQQQFHVFTTVEDVNNFVRFVAKLDTGRWFIDYGFYVRNVTDLCLAYAILHGYSGERAYYLLQQAKNKLVDAQRVTGIVEINLLSTKTQHLIDTFSKFLLATDVDDEAPFLAQIANNCSSLVLSGASTHWSAVKNALWSTAGFNRHDLDCDTQSAMDEVQIKYRDIVERITWVADSLNENEQIRNGDIRILEEGTLAYYLVARLGLFDEDEYDKDWSTRMMNGPIRCIYIVSLMKELLEEKTANTAIYAINHINTKLQSVALRGIELDATNASITEYFDFFDWFVAQCIKFEEDNPLYEDEVVAGYETFMDFLEKSMEEELGK